MLRPSTVSRPESTPAAEMNEIEIHRGGRARAATGGARRLTVGTEGRAGGLEPADDHGAADQRAGAGRQRERERPARRSKPQINARRLVVDDRRRAKATSAAVGPSSSNLTSTEREVEVLDAGSPSPSTTDAVTNTRPRHVVRAQKRDRLVAQRSSGCSIARYCAIDTVPLSSSESANEIAPVELKSPTPVPVPTRAMTRPLGPSV